MFMDVIALASLYTVRIFIGAAVINVHLTVWLIAFSMFLFLSLALVKRVSELKALTEVNKRHATGRDYRVEDEQLLLSMGVSSAFIAVLVVILFMHSINNSQTYSNPDTVWGAIPILLYWLGRMWMKTVRGEMHDDPIVFSFKDKGSLICGVAVTAVAALSIYL